MKVGSRIQNGEVTHRFPLTVLRGMILDYVERLEEDGDISMSSAIIARDLRAFVQMFEDAKHRKWAFEDARDRLIPEDEEDAARERAEDQGLRIPVTPSESLADILRPVEEKASEKLRKLRAADSLKEASDVRREP